MRKLNVSEIQPYTTLSRLYELCFALSSECFCSRTIHIGFSPALGSFFFEKCIELSFIIRFKIKVRMNYMVVSVRNLMWDGP